MNKTPMADLGSIEESLRPIAESLIEAYEDMAQPPELHAAAPQVLCESLSRLIVVLRQNDLPTGDSDDLQTRDINALGNHGIRLLADLAAWGAALHQPVACDKLRELTYAFALWLARQEGEISALQPVVDALAFVANRTKTPLALEDLYQAATDLLEAVDPALSQDFDRSNPGRPWRLLVLNRAIIATRSHQTLLMEAAFRSLTELLPEDADSFFREGMEQMDALDYPVKVREVIEKYYQLWCTPRKLH